MGLPPSHLLLLLLLLLVCSSNCLCDGWVTFDADLLLGLS